MHTSARDSIHTCTRDATCCSPSTLWGSWVVERKARCSALRVPYRATPRLPVRPVGTVEIGVLVDLSERLALHLPSPLLAVLLQFGLHPRLLANVRHRKAGGSKPTLHAVLPD